MRWSAMVAVVVRVREGSERRTPEEERSKRKEKVKRPEAPEQPYICVPLSVPRLAFWSSLRHALARPFLTRQPAIQHHDANYHAKANGLVRRALQGTDLDALLRRDVEMLYL